MAGSHCCHRCCSCCAAAAASGKLLCFCGTGTAFVVSHFNHKVGCSVPSSTPANTTCSRTISGCRCCRVASRNTLGMALLSCCKQTMHVIMPDLLSPVALMQVAAADPNARYALGSVLNHVLLHQTIIGEEALLQLAKIDETPDVVVGGSLPSGSDLQICVTARGHMCSITTTLLPSTDRARQGQIAWNACACTWLINYHVSVTSASQVTPSHREGLGLIG